MVTCGGRLSLSILLREKKTHTPSDRAREPPPSRCHRGTDIFRSKGVLNVSGSDSRHVFQGVHMLMGISSSEDGVGRGWKEGEERESRVVFIGRNLNREELVEGFEACLVK